MRRKTALPELLAPAGNFECLLAAVEGGADAVYIGGKRFGARAFAKNFDTEELARAVSYCHLHGVKLYVTVNTLIEDRELPELIEYAAELYRIGTDALIMADLGAIREIKKYIPDFEIHASTQMSVHNTRGVSAACELGVSRAVAARELSLDDIRAICDSSPLEIEVFLHGALCVCHSGQCLFSSMVGGRSGNRGECAQPCRLPFGNKYPLSLKDLSLAAHIPALIDSGVASLKIEGRMKSPDYVYTVTRIYRTLLDEHRAARPDEKESLRRAFSRGGFTDGYFVGRTERGMTGIRSDEDKEDSRRCAGRSFTPIRKKVRASVKICLGEAAEMTLTDGVRCVSVRGDIAERAESSPLTDESVRERLSKMGNTFLSLDKDDIDLTLDEWVNLSPAKLNSLRRAVAEKFENCRRLLDGIVYERVHRTEQQTPITTAHFFSEESFLRAAELDSDTLKKINIKFVPLSSAKSTLLLAEGVALPPIVFDSELDEISEMMKTARECGIKYALVGNIGQISLSRELGFTVFGDFRLNVTNSVSAEVYSEMGVERMILSPELTLPKARDIGGSVITYGRIPLMITERCFIRENFGCKSCADAALTDRRGERFPIMREFRHRNIILNSVPTYIADKRRELLEHRIRSYHLLFTRESGNEIISVLSSHDKGLPLVNHKVRRVGRR